MMSADLTQLGLSEPLGSPRRPCHGMSDGWSFCRLRGLSSPESDSAESSSSLDSALHGALVRDARAHASLSLLLEDPAPGSDRCRSFPLRR
jgi:hypothetical protein